MFEYLDFTGNTSSLKVLVDAAKALNEEVYTPETWAPFAEALKAAEAVLADENALQAEIDDAKNATSDSDGCIEEDSGRQVKNLTVW